MYSMGRYVDEMQKEEGKVVPQQSTSNGRTGCTRVFKPPQTEDKIKSLSFKNFTAQSKRKIRWAVNLFSDWRTNRLREVFVNREIRQCDLDFVNELSEADLCYAMCRFISEIKKMDGDDYPPNTLREIVIMIQMHLQQNGVHWKLLDGSEFVNLRNVLDNLMKERYAQGLGVRKSCSVITLDIENKLFEANALGEDTPEKLLKTVIYMLGLHLALRGGVEHTVLRRPGFEPQIVTELDEGSGKEILLYREDPLQKTNQGGLKSKPSSKIVKVFPSENFQRCPVRLFVKYCGLLPQSRSCGKLYLRPRAKPTPSTWYCDQPYGKNKVGQVVKDVCKTANVEGKFSNHSLRASNATRMFQNNISEQVIKEITGHKSDCVRVYKRTSDGLLKQASMSIGGNLVDESKSKKVKLETKEAKVEPIELDSDQEERVRESLSACQIIKNVIKTRMEMRRKKGKRVVSKLAKKILKSNKKKVVKKMGKSRPKGRYVIDLNVNVNVKK